MSSAYPDYQRCFKNASASQQPDLRKAIRADLGLPPLVSQPRVTQRYPATRERARTHGDRPDEAHAPRDEGPSRAPNADYRSARRDDDLRFEASQHYGQAPRRERPAQQYEERHAKSRPRDASPAPDRAHGPGSVSNAGAGAASDLRFTTRTPSQPGHVASLDRHSDAFDRERRIVPDQRQDRRYADNARHSDEQGDTYRPSDQSRRGTGQRNSDGRGGENRKRKHDGDDAQAQDRYKHQRTDSAPSPAKPKAEYSSTETNATLTKLLECDVVFDRIGLPPKPVQKEWEALRSQFLNFSDVVHRGLVPNQFGIAAMSARYAQYLSAIRKNDLALRESEKASLRHLMAAIKLCLGQPGALEERAIVNVSSALKAAIDNRLFDDDARLLKQAYTCFLEKFLSQQISNANAQEIANVGNALKAAVDARLFDDDSDLLKQAYTRFFEKFMSPRFSDDKAQHIANVGNALKAAANAMLFKDDPSLLKRAYARFFEKLLSRQFNDAYGQAIANIGSALKAAMDARFFEDDPRLLKQAYAHFLDKFFSVRQGL